MSEPALVEDEDQNPEKEEVEEYRMTLLEHLWELRTRLIRSLLAMVVAFSVMLPFGEQISAFLREPATPYFPDGSFFSSHSPLEVFVTELKMSLFAAVFLAIPVLFYQAWSFIAPGLYKSERRLVLPFVFFSTLFFTAGSSFGFFFILPFAMKFLLGFSGEGINSAISVAAYLSDVTKLLLAFGAVFQMPLGIFFLARAGIVTGEGLANFRKYAVILTFVVSAMLTPPDPVTQIGLALPLIVLYEIGVITARIWGKKPEAE
ncbi:MAG: twin-arginine translocase subunit TatC [Deltaproteobacteria bacterium]|nr:twin-arginine translocase subunit TatC [Deltaproteobacteria bacterium]